MKTHLLETHETLLAYQMARENRTQRLGAIRQKLRARWLAHLDAGRYDEANAHLRTLNQVSQAWWAAK
jgi:hypothetical protein